MIRFYITLIISCIIANTYAKTCCAQQEMLITESKYIVLDSAEYFCEGKQYSYQDNRFEGQSEVILSHLEGYVAVAMKFDTTGAKEGKEVRRTTDEIAHYFKLSRTCSKEEEEEVSKIIINHLRSKKILALYLSPYYLNDTYLIYVVPFSVN